MRPKFNGLWRHPDFLKLWSGETISLFGSQITFLALPLTAVLILKASPLEMGILGAVEFAPFLLLSLFAGVWVDRLPRRAILILADLGRASLLFSLPVAYLFNFLSMGYLYVVALLTGVMTVFFDVAYQSYLPSLVEQNQLVEGNGKLEVSRSVAQITGPGLAGSLVQLVGAPFALLLDGVSFLLSAFFLGLIRKREVVEKRSKEAKNIWKEIGEGLSLVVGNRLLRSIAACTGTSNLFNNIMTAVFTLFLINELKFEPALIGLVFGLGSVGALLGAVVAGTTARRYGVGPTIVGSAIVGGVGALLVPLAGGSVWLAVTLLIASQVIISFSNLVYNVTQVSLRQAITPLQLQGRMNASMRFIVWGTIPIGSLVGGILGEVIGLRATLWVGAVGCFASFLWVFFSPVRHLQEHPLPESSAPETSEESSVTLQTTH